MNNNFKNEYNSIQFDSDSKDRILNNLLKENHKSQKSLFGRSRARVCLVACLFVVAFAGACYAGNLFGLQDIINGNYTTDEGEKLDEITLFGSSLSEEAEATKEWTEFTSSYDVDGAEAEKADKLFEKGTPAKGTEAYRLSTLYHAYNDVMQKKLKSIADNHNLKLHTSITDAPSVSAFSNGIGNSKFCTNAINVNQSNFSGYYYEDKSFEFDADSKVKSGNIIPYQAIGTRKGTMVPASLTVRGLSNYTTTEYTTASGQQVSIDLGSGEHSLIRYQTENFTLIINVLAGKEGSRAEDGQAVTVEDLQNLIDLYDLSQLK